MPPARGACARAQAMTTPRPAKTAISGLMTPNWVTRKLSGPSGSKPCAGSAGRTAWSASPSRGPAFHSSIGADHRKRQRAARPQPGAEQPAAEIAADDEEEQDRRAEKQAGQLGDDARGPRRGRPAATSRPCRSAPAAPGRGWRAPRTAPLGASGVARMPPTAIRKVALVHNAPRSRGRPVEQDAPGQVDAERDRQPRQDGDRPDAEGIGPESPGAERDPPCPHRRVVVVAPAREARPVEIVGLVGARAG